MLSQIDNARDVFRPGCMSDFDKTVIEHYLGICWPIQTKVQDIAESPENKHDEGCHFLSDY